MLCTVYTLYIFHVIKSLKHPCEVNAGSTCQKEQHPEGRVSTGRARVSNSNASGRSGGSRDQGDLEVERGSADWGEGEAAVAYLRVRLLQRYFPNQMTGWAYLFIYLFSS